MATKSPIEETVSYLEKNGIEHEVVEHGEQYSAAAEARAAGVAPENAAKSLLLRDGDEYRLAVIPASERLDLHKARDVLGAKGKVRLATEEEMGADFPGFELGALPPLGQMLPAAEVVDPQLLEHDRILCNAGDHRHSVLIRPDDLRRVADAQVADICASEGRD